MMRKPVFAFTVLCLATSAFAAPNEASRYLMSESVSLMDWGMFQLDQLIRNVELPSRFRNAFAEARYEWDTDLVVLDVQPMLKDGAPSRLDCVDVLEAVMHGSGIDFSKRTPIFAQGYSTFAVFFSHAGYESGREPDKLLSHIDKIIEIQVIVSSFDNKKLKQVGCRTKLLDATIHHYEPSQ